MTASKLYPYIGLDAYGEEKMGNARPKFSAGRLGASTLHRMETDPNFLALPILKPLAASTYGDMAAALHESFQRIKHLPDSPERVILMYTGAINKLRQQGYDCDQLIEQGLAKCDPQYDANDIL